MLSIFLDLTIGQEAEAEAQGALVQVEGAGGKHVSIVAVGQMGAPDATVGRLGQPQWIQHVCLWSGAFSQNGCKVQECVTYCLHRSD